MDGLLNPPTIAPVDGTRLRDLTLVSSGQVGPSSMECVHGQLPHMIWLVAGEGDERPFGSHGYPFTTEVSVIIGEMVVLVSEPGLRNSHSFRAGALKYVVGQGKEIKIPPYYPFVAYVKKQSKVVICANGRGFSFDQVIPEFDIVDTG